LPSSWTDPFETKISWFLDAVYDGYTINFNKLFMASIFFMC
jgi:hypothetical protein